MKWQTLTGNGELEKKAFQYFKVCLILLLTKETEIKRKPS